MRGAARHRAPSRQQKTRRRAAAGDHSHKSETRIYTVADLALTSKQLASDTPHTRGTVTLLPRRASDNEVRWKFTDERGRGWSGVGVAEPSAEDKSKFVVTLKLARDNSR